MCGPYDDMSNPALADQPAEVWCANDERPAAASSMAARWYMLPPGERVLVILGLAVAAGFLLGLATAELAVVPR